MSCLTIKNKSGAQITILYDGDQELDISAGATHAELYAPETVSTMLISLEELKRDDVVEYTVHDFIALPRQPSSSDDKTKAVRVGERFFNTSTGINYFCKDNSAGSAVWVDVLGIPAP
jgi:hypothetical protein